MTSMEKFSHMRMPLIIYDLFTILGIYVLLFLPQYINRMSDYAILWHGGLVICVYLVGRIAWGIYRQIWRYGGIHCYIRLLLCDFSVLICFLIVDYALHDGELFGISYRSLIAYGGLNTLCALSIRLLYYYAYKNGGRTDKLGYFLRGLLILCAGRQIIPDLKPTEGKIKLAIVGAGAAGVSFTEELRDNPLSEYLPLYFLDVKKEKIGRRIHGLEVLQERAQSSIDELKEAGIQTVVITIPKLHQELRKKLYEYYKGNGFQVKVYDYPVLEATGKKRVLREFDIEELLFRQPVYVMEDEIKGYYRGKIILVTGGGGSIGSELCRQLASMEPKQLIVLDVYENGAYDLQQELHIKYSSALNLQLEILSVTNKSGMSKVFEAYKPQIVIHAAAHKHVPLMEHNCVEAVENNVFGTLNVVQLCEEYGAERFMMVSTDKAVNPTNVMGATKRMCEMIVNSYSTFGKVKYSSTRFGNVLGSAGSVIPLFKKQIASGGPITLTDKRIIRYFMTIPEASQLVLTSGAMAKNGELFVLDMGEPVKILDLAENMIKLSGMSGIEIKEVGLRPGEKLYEELLIDSTSLTKTANSKIFIEEDEPLSKNEIDQMLELLNKAISKGENDGVVHALQSCVPTFMCKNN